MRLRPVAATKSRPIRVVTDVMSEVVNPNRSSLRTSDDGAQLSDRTKLRVGFFFVRGPEAW
jgi:hypothetical protein